MARTDSGQLPSLGPPGFDAPGDTAALARATDWSQTPLGPVEQWPASLRVATGICLSSPSPMAVVWGRELVMLYNDGYIPIVGPEKHPAAFGGRVAEWFGEVWPTIGPMIDAVFETGVATGAENLSLRLRRHGILDESAFTFSYSPIHDDGRVAGIFIVVTETTEQGKATRRLGTLSELARVPKEAGAHGVCVAASRVLAGNTQDLPFAAVYLRGADGEDQLAACAGVEPGSALAPPQLDIDRPPWPVVGTLPGGPRTRLFAVDSSACERAAALPLDRGEDEYSGWLLAGLSPHQRLDAAYAGFLTTVTRRLAGAVAGAQAVEREREAAGALRREQLVLSEVIQRAPAGICLLWGPEHRFRLVNQRYREIVPGSEFIGRPFAEALPEGAGMAIPALDEVLHTGQVLSFENLPVPFGGEGSWQGQRFYTFTLSPIRDVDGTVGGVLGVAMETTETMRRQVELEHELSVESRIAETLQRALLPAALPHIPGTRVAARYQAAGEHYQVGGDFYDAFENGDGTWTVVVGDVCGKGPEAAALTALARYTLRAQAGHDSSPGRLLDLLNEDMLRHHRDHSRTGADFASLVCARVTLSPPGAEITLASGGHPPPVVVRGDGAVEEARALGELVGLFPSEPREETRLTLGPGDAILLYTDGVTEARAPREVLSTADLGRLLTGCAGAPADDLVRTIADHMPPTESLRDDYALVALSVDA